MTPNSTVTLYSTPFDISNEFVIVSKSEEESYAIVSGYPHQEFTQCVWQRDNTSFRANGNINDLKQYNYCIYQNNGKRNYAFITNFEYINDEMTLVNISIDYWLNYAGEYSFYSSPMLRCHPLTDSAEEDMSYEVEPININNWTISLDSRGFKAEGDADRCILVTQVNADDDLLTQDSKSMPSNVFLILKDAFNNASGILQTVLNNYYGCNQITYCRCGNIIQPPTYACDRTTAAKIVRALSLAGYGDKIITAYSIPTFINSNIAYTTSMAPLTTLPDAPLISGDLLINEKASQANYSDYYGHWRKLKYSPQFNNLQVSFFGNTLEIPWSVLSTAIQTGTTLKYYIKSNPSMNGYATLTISVDSDIEPEIKDTSIFSIDSPQWDRVQVIGTGVDRVLMSSAILKGAVSVAVSGIGMMTSPSAFNVSPVQLSKYPNMPYMASGFLPGPTAKNGFTKFDIELGENPRKSILQSAISAGYMANAESSAINSLQNINKDSVHMSCGNSNSGCAVYNSMNAIIQLMQQTPSLHEIKNICKMFGTYGYTYNGRVMSINANFNHMPKWCYYHTLKASITGNKVPQEDLNKLISRFNNGIFIFRSKDGYKNLQNWSLNHY